MATSGLHCNGGEKVTTCVMRFAQRPSAGYIVVQVDDDHRVYLPSGLDSVVMARSLAAELLRAADELDAYLAPAGEVEVPA